MIDFNEFKDLVKKSRCTRRFKKDFIIEDQDLIDLVDLARFTSSAKNLQPLKYIIINKNKEIFQKLYEPLVWAAHLKEWTQKEDEKPSAFILVLEDKDIQGFSLIDAGIAMQTISLGARVKGLATCMLASIDKELYKKVLNLEKNLEPLFIIALGKQNEQIKIVKAKSDINYFRDNKDIHCVPKRDLKDILIGVF